MRHRDYVRRAFAHSLRLKNDEGDIYGDGVNVAARLEALAEPGGICVSRVVRDQVRDKLSYAFEDMCEQIVKNIAWPMRVYAMKVAAVATLPPLTLRRRRVGPHAAARARDGTHRGCRSSSCRLRTSRTRGGVFPVARKVTLLENALPSETIAARRLRR